MSKRAGPSAKLVQFTDMSFLLLKSDTTAYECRNFISKSYNRGLTKVIHIPDYHYLHVDCHAQKIQR